MKLFYKILKFETSWHRLLKKPIKLIYLSHMAIKEAKFFLSLLAEIMFLISLLIPWKITAAGNAI